MKYNPTHYGAVVTFKEGTTEEEAKAALEKIADLLDYPAQVNSYDPDWGGPVWYVP